jgi:hypothetical protein
MAFPCGIVAQWRVAVSWRIVWGQRTVARGRLCTARQLSVHPVVYNGCEKQDYATERRWHLRENVGRPPVLGHGQAAKGRGDGLEL